VLAGVLSEPVRLIDMLSATSYSPVESMAVTAYPAVFISVDGIWGKSFCG